MAQKGRETALWEYRGGKEKLTVRGRRAHEALWARGWHGGRALKKTYSILTGTAGILGRKELRSKGKEEHR